MCSEAMVRVFLSPERLNGRANELWLFLSELWVNELLTPI